MISAQASASNLGERDTKTFSSNIYFDGSFDDGRTGEATEFALREIVAQLRGAKPLRPACA
jgi:hypothetical protein